MATISGKYPVEPYLSHNPYYSTNIFSKAGSGYTYEQTSEINGFGAAEPYVATVRNSWAASAPWDVTVSGVPTPQLPQKTFFGPVIKVNNAPFNVRKNRGEMVVSDFNNLKAIVTYINGGNITEIGPPMSQMYSINSAFGPFGWKPIQWYGPLSRYALDPTGNTGVALGDFWNGPEVRGVLKHYRQMTKDDGLTPYDVGWKDAVVQSFMDHKYTVGYLINNTELFELVTATTAEANRRTVDMLTALAELPESIKSIKDLILDLIRFYKDARKGHFRWQNKAKRVQREHEAKIYRINFKSNQAYLAARNDRARRIIEHKRQQDVSQARRDLALTLKEIADAVTQVWLTFRYAIMPNVFLIEDIVKSMGEGESEYIRYAQKRELTIFPFEMEGFTRTGEIPVTVRCFIKRQFNAVELANAPYSWNFAVSLWELLPLSFVLDWIINLGDVIAAFTGSTSQYKEVSTISVTTHSSNVTYVHDESEAKVNVLFSGYTRNVIVPQDYCALVFDPFVDLQRQLDAASLTYQIAIKSALTSLINRRG